ncbi:MAG: NADH-quinone oxidoreductase subunit J [Syntrophomonadaceae bacterium]
MNIYDIVFYLFAAITLASAFVVVTARNIIYSAFSLLFTFFGVAGLYVLLGADFIAVVQLMVYVGGILVLILFGVMLTNKITSIQIKTGTLQIVPAILGAALMAGVLIKIFTGTNWHSQSLQNPAQTTAYALGKMLITDYVLIFELLGILLLIALIGAATIARKDEQVS